MHLTKRQRQIYEYLKDHIRSRQHAPSIAEIGKHFHLSSPATVHKHLSNLEKKGVIRKQENLSRAIEVVPEPGNALSYPLMGEIAAGKPIEALDQHEVIDLLPDGCWDKDVFVLRVKGDSMIDDHIQSGDYVIAESRNVAENGETVVALIEDRKSVV